MCEGMQTNSVVNVREVLQRKLLKAATCLKANERQIDEVDPILVLDADDNARIRELRVDEGIVACNPQVTAERTLGCDSMAAK